MTSSVVEAQCMAVIISYGPVMMHLHVFGSIYPVLTHVPGNINYSVVP